MVVPFFCGVYKPVGGDRKVNICIISDGNRRR